MGFDFRKFIRGIKLIPNSGTTSTTASKGEIDVTSDGKAHYHNGTSSSPIVTELHASQGSNRLKSKDLEDTTTAIVSAANPTTRKIIFDATGGGIGASSTTIVSSQTINRILTLPNITDTIVTKNTIDVLTNKTLTAPVLNSPTADTITGITGGNLQLSSAVGQVVRIEDISFDSNTITGGASTLTIQSASNQNLSVQAQGTGIADIASKFSLSSVANSQSGSDQTISTTTKPYIKLTNSSLVSIGGVTASSNDGQFVILTNSTGNPVVILNESAGATASDRIITGTGGNATIAAAGSALLIYNTTSARWQIVSVIQASSIPAPSITTITTSTALTGSNDYVLVDGTGVTVTLPNPNTLTPGKTFTIKKIANNNIAVTINTVSGTIDDTSTKTITSQYDSLTITTDGTNYFII